MSLDYQHVYTDLRTGKLSFAQFMDFLDQVHLVGMRRGFKIVAPAENGKPGAAKPSKIEYESIF